MSKNFVILIKNSTYVLVDADSIKNPSRIKYTYIHINNYLELLI